MSLVLVIVLSFAMFFFIIDFNSPSGDESYIEEYSGYGPIDAVISVYLLSSGEFSFDRYGYVSGDSKFLWVMFLLATFINMIVFMNMLIAIMGETFG